MVMVREEVKIVDSRTKNIYLLSQASQPSGVAASILRRYRGRIVTSKILERASVLLMSNVFREQLWSSSVSLW